MIDTINGCHLKLPDRNSYSGQTRSILAKIENIWSVFRPSILKISDMTIGTVPVIFILVTFTLESLYPAYDRMQNTISELVWGPHGWSMSVLFLIFGLALMVLALRLSSIISDSICLKVGAVLLFLAGLGFIIITIFPTRAPGAAQSIKALIHLQTARGISAAFPLTCIFIAIGLRDRSDWQFVRVFTLTAGMVTLLFDLAGALATFTGAEWMGAAERLIMMPGLIWIEVIGIHLLFPKIRGHINQNRDTFNTRQRESREHSFQGMIPAPQYSHVIGNSGVEQRNRL